MLSRSLSLSLSLSRTLRALSSPLAPTHSRAPPHHGCRRRYHDRTARRSRAHTPPRPAEVVTAADSADSRYRRLQHNIALAHGKLPLRFTRRAARFAHPVLAIFWDETITTAVDSNDDLGDDLDADVEFRVKPGKIRAWLAARAIRHREKHAENARRRAAEALIDKIYKRNKRLAAAHAPPSPAHVAAAAAGGPASDVDSDYD